MARVMDESLLATQRAFDAVAPTYHRSNVENVLLNRMRERARQALRRHVAPPARVLDLGCGPGTDAEAFGHEGYCVTAVDLAPGMIAEARQRIAAAGLAARVEARQLGMHELDSLPRSYFDAAFSNFGALNCVSDLDATAAAVGRVLRPGATFVASVIGRVCPWEIALYAARGDWKRATIRFSNVPVPVPLEGRTVWTSYYSPGALGRAFETAGFRRVNLRALGLFLPPPYLNAFAARQPRLVGVLQRIDDCLGAAPILRALGDHFLITFRKEP